MIRSFFIIAALLGSVATVIHAAPTTQPHRLSTTQPAVNLEGKIIEPLNLAAGHRAAVLMFVSTDCPISNTFAPTIAGLCKSFSPRGVDFYTVYTRPDQPAAEIREHHAAYQLPCESILDSAHDWVKSCGAHVTPEAFVIDSDGLVQYSGRIDDLYTSIGHKRFAATTHDLRDVLEQIVDGEPVTVKSEPAVGCTISQ